MLARYRCPDCGYIYDEARGDPHEGFPPGTPWSKVDETWSCPDCAVRDKVDFEPLDPAPAPMPAQASPAPETLTARPAAADVIVTERTEVVREVVILSPAGGEATFRKWMCMTCGHVYDEALGDPDTGIPPGTRFEAIPADWRCPDCGATKEDYSVLDE